MGSVIDFFTNNNMMMIKSTYFYTKTYVKRLGNPPKEELIIRFIMCWQREGLCQALRMQEAVEVQHETQITI